jgi:hypothetical protein
MAKDLTIFMVCWIVEIIIFASVSNLLFNDTSAFSSFEKTIVFYINTALGNINTDAYCV